MNKRTIYVFMMVLMIIMVGCTSVQPPLACTKEGKICPDGTVVGRNAARNCEFDPCPAGQQPGETPQSNVKTFDITFKTIAQNDGMTSSVETKQQFMITSKEKWEELWNTIHSNVEPRPALPDVDFSRSVVLAVFQGRKGSGGHTIEITKIVDSFPEDVRTVSVKEISPGNNCFVTEVITSPDHIVEMSWPGDETRVEFKIEQQTIDCE